MVVGRRSSLNSRHLIELDSLYCGYKYDNIQKKKIERVFSRAVVVAVVGAAVVWSVFSAGKKKNILIFSFCCFQFWLFHANINWLAYK